MPTCLLRRGDRPAGGGGGAGDGFVGEGDVEDAAAEAMLGHQCLYGEVACGRVVLMDGVDGDAVAGGVGGIGEGLPPDGVAAVSDADPVDRAEDDRPAGAEEDDASGGEGVGDLACGRPAAVAERRADGGGHVGLEGCDGQGLG